MNGANLLDNSSMVSAGCHINDVMNNCCNPCMAMLVSAGCHINDVMNWRLSIKD